MSLMFFGLKHNSLVDPLRLKSILNDVLSTRLAEYGLKWNQAYLWSSDFNNSIKHVFQYANLKGGQGTFSWGVCLDFLPTISSNRILYHNTHNNVKLHLFEWANEFANSFFGGDLSNGITSHWGEKQTKASVQKLFDKYDKQIFGWFEQANSLDGLIEITKRQIEIGKSYNFHDPGPGYVLAFLQAKIGLVDDALKTFDQLVSSTSIHSIELQRKLKVRLQKSGT